MEEEYLIILGLDNLCRTYYDALIQEKALSREDHEMAQLIFQHTKELLLKRINLLPESIRKEITPIVWTKI